MTDTGAGNAGVVGSGSIEIRATVSRLRSDLTKIERLVAQSGDQVTRDARRMETAFSKINSSLETTSRLATLTFGGLAAGVAVGEIIRQADAYQNMSARIRLVLKDGEDFTAVQEQIFRAAQRTRVSLESLTTIYTRLRQAQTSLSSGQALQFAETLAQLSALSGSTAEETASFLTQFSQALSKGTLQGDEFRSVMENNARFAALISESLGKSRGELLKMSAAGQITGDTLRDVVLNNAEGINAEFQKLPLTIGGAFQQLQNAFTQYLGQTNSSLGASTRFAEAISLVAKNFRELADAMVLIGTVAIGSLAGRGVNAVGRTVFDVMAEQAARDVANANKIRSRIDQLTDLLDKAHNARIGVTNQARELFDEMRPLQERLSDVQAEIERQASLGTPGRPGGRINIPRDDAPRAGPGGGSSGSAFNKLLEERADLEREINRVEADSLRIQNSLSLSEQTIAKYTRELARETGNLNQRFTLGGKVAVGFGLGVDSLKRGFASLVDFLGGPWGVAITAVSVGFLLMRNEAERSARAMAGVQSTLELIATSSVAGSAADSAENLAHSAAQAAHGMHDAATASRELHTATSDLADAGNRAADATDAQARASRALTAARNAEAIATTRSNIVEAQRELNRLQGEQNGGLRLLTDMPNVDARFEARQAQIDQLKQIIPIMQSGLDALTSGALVPQAVANAATSSGTNAADPEKKLREILQYVRDTGDAIEGVRRAAAYNGPGGPDRGIREILGLPEALGNAGEVGDPLLKFKAVIERLHDLEAAAGGHGAGAFGRATADAILEMNRAARLGVDAFSALDEAVRRGLITSEEADAAKADIRSLGEDYTRARGIVENARSALANANRDLAEFMRLRTEGIFGDIGDQDGAARALVSYLEEVAKAAGDATDALAILHSQTGLDPQFRTDSERQIRDAAREGRFALEEQHDTYWRTKDFRDSISQGLYDAFRTGDWKQAFADSVNSVLNNALQRASQRLADIITDAIIGSTKAKSSNGIISTIISAVTGGGGGGGSKTGTPPPVVRKRANGGHVMAGGAYMVGEQGPEPFFPGVSGTIMSNHNMREALSGANSGAGAVRLVVDARTDGSVDLKIRAAEHRATVSGGALGAQMVSKMFKSQRST